MWIVSQSLSIIEDPTLGHLTELEGVRMAIYVPETMVMEGCRSMLHVCGIGWNKKEWTVVEAT